MHEPVDAEIDRVDGLNYAKLCSGLLPVYDFPVASTKGTVPAVQLNGVWFRVNPIASEELKGSTATSVQLEVLEAENARLTSLTTSLTEELEKTKVELEAVRHKRELEQHMLNEERKMISGLKLELESLKRRQAGHNPSLARTVSDAKPTTTSHSHTNGHNHDNAATKKTAAAPPSSTSVGHTPSTTSSVKLPTTTSAASLVMPGSPKGYRAHSNSSSVPVHHNPVTGSTRTPAQRESLRLSGYALPAEDPATTAPEKPTLGKPISAASDPTSLPKSSPAQRRLELNMGIEH